MSINELKDVVKGSKSVEDARQKLEKHFEAIIWDLAKDEWEQMNDEEQKRLVVKLMEDV